MDSLRKPMIRPMAEPSEVARLDLGDGRVASIRRCRAPLPAPEGMALGWFLEGAFGTDDKPDIFVTMTAKGLLEDVARNDFAWAEVDGDVVSTAWTMTPADDPRLATLGEVYTDPAWRGHGLAPAVCRALLERFDDGGGRCIFLATGNPSAARIYRSLGFEPWPRGLMRRDAAGPGFDDEWFAASGTTIRPVTWGDTPRLVALYAAPNPWLSVCWMQGLYSASVVTHDRCNSLVKHTWQATRPGAWLGMVNAEGALVGSGPMEPRGNEKDVIGVDVDVFVHPVFPSAGRRP
jgi:ribosomal protein S18 acetylase RimI-like enzyme